MAIISIVALLLFFLFYTLATQMQLAAESTKHIQANVSIVANNMQQMNKLVSSLEKRKNRLVTTMFIRTTFAILFVAAIVDGFLLHTLSDGIKESLHHVDVMSKDFNTIVENMNSITLSVSGIDNKMTALSHISDNVFTIGNKMGLLTQDMDTLVITFNGIENEIQYMDTSILFVDNRVRGMSHDMHYIG